MTVVTALKDLGLSEEIATKISKVNRDVDPPIILIFNIPQLSQFFDLLVIRSTNNLITMAPPMNLQGKLLYNKFCVCSSM